MANICEYTMRIRGKGKDLQKFVAYLSADYSISHDDKKAWCSSEHHIGYRVFDVWGSEELLFIENEQEATIEIYGDCAWSLVTCLMDDEVSGYLKQNRERDPYVWSLKEASANLNLDIEAYSRECGMEFAEHIFYKLGAIIIDECVDYMEVCIEDYETYEDFLNDSELDEEIKKSISKTRFDETRHHGSDYVFICEYDFYHLKWRLDDVRFHS